MKSENIEWITPQHGYIEYENCDQVEIVEHSDFADDVEGAKDIIRDN